MRQLELFQSELVTHTLRTSITDFSLGDLIDVNGKIFEIDSVLRYRSGGGEYTYRPYPGPL